jgi:hypothetical protein
LLEHAAYTVVCWYLGLYYLLNFETIRAKALSNLEKHPNVFKSRAAEREGYWTFMRSIAVVILLAAVFFTLRAVFDLWVEHSWR